MCKLGNVTLLSTKWAHFKFDACDRSQKLAQGQQKAETARNFINIQLGENLATNEVNWYQVTWSAIKGCLREAVSLRWRCAEAIPICEKVRKKIVEYHQNNVSQRQIEKVLQISSSTKDWEKLETSLCVRDNNPCGIWALRQHCITHRHNCDNDITKWAQEYFQKPLSVNTIHRAICRCQLKLYQAERKPYWNMSVWMGECEAKM